jgi:hypothetical protein
MPPAPIPPSPNASEPGLPEEPPPDPGWLLKPPVGPTTLALDDGLVTALVGAGEEGGGLTVSGGGALEVVV